MTRQPISSGPRWLGRLFGPKRSWPSTLKTGTKTTVTCSSTPGSDLAVEQVAQQPEARVLAVDLAGVDAALEEDHRAVCFFARGGGERAVRRGDEREHRAALGRGAERLAAHLARVALAKARTERMTSS